MTDYFPIFVGFLVIVISTYGFFCEKVDKYEKETKRKVMDEVERSQNINEDHFMPWSRAYRRASRPASNLDSSLFFGGGVIVSSLVGWIGDLLGFSLEPYLSYAVVICGVLFTAPLIYVLLWHRTNRIEVKRETT